MKWAVSAGGSFKRETARIAKNAGRSGQFPKNPELGDLKSLVAPEDCCVLHTGQHCRTVAATIESGLEVAEESRSKPPSTLPDQNSVFKNQNGDV